MSTSAEWETQPRHVQHESYDRYTWNVITKCKLTTFLSYILNQFAFHAGIKPKYMHMMIRAEFGNKVKKMFVFDVGRFADVVATANGCYHRVGMLPVSTFANMCPPRLKLSFLYEDQAGIGYGSTCIALNNLFNRPNQRHG
jgi:hypothetical protein